MSTQEQVHFPSEPQAAFESSPEQPTEETAIKATAGVPLGEVPAVDETKPVHKVNGFEEPPDETTEVTDPPTATTSVEDSQSTQELTDEGDPPTEHAEAEATETDEEASAEEVSPDSDDAVIVEPREKEQAIDEPGSVEETD
eukprot:c4015_g1_i1 orf=431-856(-)